jgi:hypothetical protein
MPSIENTPWSVIFAIFTRLYSMLPGSPVIMKPLAKRC